MRLKRVEISNYKSLKSVAIEPTPLCVLVGPNAAGKTNFGDALDFLGHVYKWGIEEAVEKKGGYENICHRNDEPESKSSIRFRAVFGPLLGKRRAPYTLDHTFEFKKNSRKTHDAISVTRESLKLTLEGDENPIFRFIRSPIRFSISPAEEYPGAEILKPLITSSQLAAPILGPLLPVLGPFSKISSLRVYQLNPRNCREAGIPTPNANLDQFGSNLPAAVSHLKKHSPEEYKDLIDALRRVLPSVEDIDLAFTHTKTLSLFLKERGVKQPWPVEDVSDGTIQAIALLAATFDPRTSVVVLEEPENSVHPWAVRTFVEAFRLASQKKQIILTTHSPMVVDQLQPEEIWIVQRPGTETKVDPLLSLDPSLKEAWGQGKFTLSEYLDSGAVPEAVPAVNS